MNTITIKLPDNVQIKGFDAEMYLASRWYEEGILSSGQAAKMIGLSKRAFIELLGKYNTSVFGYDFDELQNDLKNA